MALYPELFEFVHFLHFLTERNLSSEGNTGPVHVLKGKEILPDGSTLESSGIIDGSTISILIEPEQCIEVKIKCDPKVYVKEVNNSITVAELKQELVKSRDVTFPVDNFSLMESSP